MASKDDTAMKVKQYGSMLYEKKIVNEEDTLALTIDNFLSKEECKQLIQLTEEKGYEKALVNTGFGRQKLMLDVRNCDRCIIDDLDMAEKFWKKCEAYVPKLFRGCKAVGLNERMRFLRYDKGCYFKPHHDGSYIRPDSEEISYVTFFLFLNDGYKGGESTFLKLGEEKVRVEIRPKPGRLVIFQHHIYHEGSILKKGRKYALRTDVMYKK